MLKTRARDVLGTKVEIDPLLSDPEVCDVLGVSRQTLHRYRKAGIVPERVRIGPPGSLQGGTPASEIAAVIEARKRERDTRIADRDRAG
jgi:predicted DNA-binding transcriptional regulator AlpA